MKTDTKTQLYLLHLDDAAVPPFVSSDKIYVGAENDLQLIAHRFEEEDSYTETAAGIREYFRGNHTVVHTIAHREYPILEPVRYLDYSFLIQDGFEWEHMNAWGFPYRMGCSKAVYTQIVFLYEKKYYRCIRARLTNPYYLGDNSEKIYLKDGFWGNRCNLLVQPSLNGGFDLKSVLYVVEKRYDSKIEATSQLHSIEHIDLAGICEDIFADG